MTTKLFPLLSLGLALSACATGERETVIIDGREGFPIYPVAMIGTDQPTPENVAKAVERIKTGNHGGGLKRVSAGYCPDGHDILEERKPVANIYVFQPFVQYRVTQEFIIACT